jgi:hypothetical protein
MYYANFGHDEEGNSLECLGTEFETVEEIAQLCQEYQVSVTIYNEPGFKIGQVDADGNWSLNG